MTDLFSHILAHAPVLLVVLPMSMAVMVALVPSGKVAGWLATLATWLVLALVAGMWPMIPAKAGLFYPLGGWLPPLGIEYRVDGLTIFVLAILAVVAALVMPYASRQLAATLEPERQPMGFAAMLLCLSGLNGMVVTHDAFNLYVFLEISSLATYALIALGQDRRALSAAFHYLVLGTVGATFILIGIGFLYIMTGTLNMSDLAARLHAMQDSPPILAAAAFILVGLMLKVALFPLHMWMPNAYSYAPTSISSLLSATATKVGFYAMVRFIWTVFGAEPSFTHLPIEQVLVVLSVVAILAGSLVALAEPNLKRMLAFSSVAQVGYIALGLGLGTAAGLAAGLVHLANHALAKGALFMAVGCLGYGLAGVGLRDITLTHVAGLFRRMPWSSLGFALSGLALIGVPLTGGFVSKWQLAVAVLEEPYGWGLLVVIVLGSLLAVAYILKVLEALIFATPVKATQKVKEAPLTMLIPMWVMVVLSLWVGVDSRLTLGMARYVANDLAPTAIRVVEGESSQIHAQVEAPHE
jgi:multicomponent Na+:H+ antiporter subunit D